MKRNVQISFLNVVKRTMRVTDVMLSTTPVLKERSPVLLALNVTLSRLFQTNVQIVMLPSVIRFVLNVRSGHLLIFSIVMVVEYAELVLQTITLIVITAMDASLQLQNTRVNFLNLWISWNA